MDEGYGIIAIIFAVIFTVFCIAIISFLVYIAFIFNIQLYESVFFTIIAAILTLLLICDIKLLVSMLKDKLR